MENQITKNRELDILRYVVNNSKEEIAACTTDGNFLFANDLMVKNHCLEGDLTFHSIRDLNAHEFSGRGWNEFVSKLKKNGDTIQMQVRLDMKESGLVFYEVKANYTVYNSQEVVWLFANNITDKILQNDKIKELNYVMEAILNNIPVYLFVKDTGKDFRYIYWNKAFETFSKIPSSKVLGNTDYEVFPSRADAEKFRKDDLTVLHKGTPIEFDEEYVDGNGHTRYCHTLKALIKSDKELPWIIGVSWDITEQKETEKALIAARHKAEQSDKLKSTFLANMSHEIRTPLNAIVGFSKLLNEAEEEERIQYLKIIEDNADLLLQLINDILDISKIEAGTLDFMNSMVNINDMFSDIYEMNRQRMNESVQLVYDGCKEKFIIRTDRNRLLQVVTNLLNNAIKFTQQGEIRFGFNKKGDFLEFYVKDTGMGISEQNLDSIFNRFIKLNSFIQGTGLGLSICHTIVERIGGKIWAESTEGLGSTFYFTIPCNEDCTSDIEQHTVIRKKNPSTDKRRKKILVAEDIDTHYILIHNMLKSDYDIIHSNDGEAAVAMCRTENPDLVLMDIKLPFITGLEATTAIRTFSDVPVIAMTSYAFDSDRQDALNSGCTDFISKPVSYDLLIRTIEKYI